MLKIKPFMRSVVSVSALPALLLTSSFSYAVTDAEVEALKARIAALETTPTWSSAQLQEVEALSIHGFVNAGVSTANTDKITGSSGGIGDEMNFQAHQSFGLQVGYQLDEKTDVVAQMLGRAYQDNMNVRMNWAYIGRSLLQDKGPMSDLKLRVGRAPADIYMISEYYDVGYAYPWVTPPREAYDLLGGVPYDGIDLTASFTLPGEWNMHLKGFAGQVNVQPVAGQTRFDLNKIRGVNAIFERDAWRIRIGHGQASVKYEVCCDEEDGFTRLSEGFNDLEKAIATLETSVSGILMTPISFGYTPTPITDKADNLSGSFGGVGLTYDNGNWLVMGEYMLQKWDTYNPDMDLAYITVGKRFGDWMPYVTASQAKVADDDDVNEFIDKLDELNTAANSVPVQTAEGGLAALMGTTPPTTLKEADELLASTVSAYEQALVGHASGAVTADQVVAAQAQVAVAQSLQSFHVLRTSISAVQGGMVGLSLPQKTYSIGVRYDFAPGATAKLQVDKITGFEDTRGSLENAYISHFAIQAAF